MKKIFLILLALLALSLFLSCTKENYKEKIDPVIDKYVEAWNTGNLTLLNGIVDSTFELRKVPDFLPLKGIKALEDYIVQTRTVIPDFMLKKDLKLFVGDSAVAVTWTFSGTYKGESELPPTGKKLDVPGFSILFFSGDKLTGEWIAFSDLTMFKQLGYNIVLPETKEK